jgi:hypothetical protein
MITRILEADGNSLGNPPLCGQIGGRVGHLQAAGQQTAANIKQLLEKGSQGTGSIRKRFPSGEAHSIRTLKELSDKISRIILFHG